MVSSAKPTQYGSGIAAGLGFMFQDRGELFSMEPGHITFTPGNGRFTPSFPVRHEDANRGKRLCHGRRHAPQGHVSVDQPDRFR